jgi:HSP20 family molecular chaperone IbpA
MNTKVLYGVIALLLFACLGQAYYIHLKKSADPAVSSGTDWPSRTDKLQQDVRKKLQKREALPPELFDDFFNDEFFGRRFNPFEEMERMHRQMAEMFQETEKQQFNNSWGKWFSERIGMDDFKTNIFRTDKNVILTMTIPGVDSKTADININNDRIRISFSAKNVQDKKEGGGVMHSESSQSYIKIMPIPDDAIPGTAKIEIKNNQVTITFDKKSLAGKN